MRAFAGTAVIARAFTVGAVLPSCAATAFVVGTIAAPGSVPVTARGVRTFAVTSVGTLLATALRTSFTPLRIRTPESLSGPLG